MADQEIILYHYHFSPFAKRIVWYLNLRRIPYTQCLQPPYLPRSDIKAIGTNYRRIPLLSIGRSIYLDTRLILLKFSQLFPPSTKHPGIDPTSPQDLAIQSLLSSFMIESMFTRCAALIPVEMPLLNDPKFTKDREDYTGRSWSRAAILKGRPEALVEVRSAFELLERALIGDGRKWILGNEGPSVVDIEGVWLFLWVRGMKGALPGNLISEKQFPKTWAWMDRFEAAVKEAGQKMGRPKTVKGEEAVRIVMEGGFVEEVGEVEALDPSGLKKGEEVEVWPTDTGFNHKDRGSLVKLDREEIVVEKSMGDGSTKVRVHAPRHGFRVVRVDRQKL